MGALLGLLTSKITGPISTAAALVLLVLLVTSQCTVRDLRGELVEVRAGLNDAKNALATCHANTTDLTMQITVQNSAIADLKAAADRDTAAAAAALVAARRDFEAASADATRLLNMVTPQGDVCAAALDLARENLR